LIWDSSYSIFFYDTYTHTYQSRFIPKGVAAASQIVLRDAHVLPKWLSYEKYCRRDRWWAHCRIDCSLSQVGILYDTVDPSVVFYDTHGRKREVVFFCSVPDTTRDVQSTAHRTINFALCTALISRVLALILNYRCIAWRTVGPYTYVCRYRIINASTNHR
jgi:hypothetical protein